MLMNAMHAFEFWNLNNKKFLIPLNFQKFENLGMLHTPSPLDVSVTRAQEQKGTWTHYLA